MGPPAHPEASGTFNRALFAARFGVRATPTWLIAGKMITGLRPDAEFEALARQAIRPAG